MKKVRIVFMVLVICAVAAVSAQAAESRWLWPARDCYIVSSNFGNRDLDGNGVMDDVHNGMDIIGSGSTFGQPVLAAKSGNIFGYCNRYGDEEKVWTSDMSSFGNYVIIDHLDGTYSIYAHMRQSGIKTSGAVAQGDVIGYIGNSGSSYGAHLHFQIFKDPSRLSKVLVNPMPVNAEIKINNIYSLPSGFPADQIDYIFSVSEDYLSRCTFQRSYCTVEIQTKTVIKSLPCSKGTDARSLDIVTAVPGAQYAVTGLFRNTEGNWWYRVDIEGEAGYVYSGSTKFLQYNRGAYITGAATPQELSVGSRYSIRGVVVSELTDLIQVGATIKQGDKTIFQAYEGVAAGGSYDLLNSQVDYGMRFNELAEGWYTYQVYVGEVNSWANGTELHTEKRWPAIYTREFKVGDPPAMDYHDAPIPNSATVRFFGKKIEFDQPPVIIDGRTMVPVRAVFEAMEVSIRWDDATKTVTAWNAGRKITLTIGKNSLTIGDHNGKNQTVTMDAVAVIRSGRTLIPARFVAEAFGYTVDWNPKTRTVLIGN